MMDSTNNSLTYNNYNIQSDIDILYQIISSSQFSDEYFSYCFSNRPINKSSSEDDRHFCLLILKFISPSQDKRKTYAILESFLCKYRYRRKFHINPDYLLHTISKVINFAIDKDIIGSLCKPIYDLKAP